MKIIVKFLEILLISTMCILSFILGYDMGYSKSMDNYMQASECKPSFKWRQRRI